MEQLQLADSASTLMEQEATYYREVQLFRLCSDAASNFTTVCKMRTMILTRKKAVHMTCCLPEGGLGV